MKNVKNMNDIAAIATAKVNELIANGFIFNFGTMAGSQGNDLIVLDCMSRIYIYR